MRAKSVLLTVIDIQLTSLQRTAVATDDEELSPDGARSELNSYFRRHTISNPNWITINRTRTFQRKGKRSVPITISNIVQTTQKAALLSPNWVLENQLSTDRIYTATSSLRLTSPILYSIHYKPLRSPCPSSYGWYITVSPVRLTVRPSFQNQRYRSVNTCFFHCAQTPDNVSCIQHLNKNLWKAEDD
jgi:hypothetical protein